MLTGRSRELILQTRWDISKGTISKEDDVGGRARVTRDEERVLRGGWTNMRLCRHGGWVAFDWRPGMGLSYLVQSWAVLSFMYQMYQYRQCTDHHKRIKGLFVLSYSERLKRLQLDSLCVRRLKSDLIMCYKIINNLVDLDCSGFFVLEARLTLIVRVVTVVNFLRNSVLWTWGNTVLLTALVSLGTIYPTIFSGIVVLALFRKLIDTVDLSGYSRY